MKFQPIWNAARKNLRSFNNFSLTRPAIEDLLKGAEYTEAELQRVFTGSSQLGTLRGEYRILDKASQTWEIHFWLEPPS